MQTQDKNNKKIIPIETYRLALHTRTSNTLLAPFKIFVLLNILKDFLCQIFLAP